MKKTVVLIAALLSFLPAYSREASDDGLSGELQIVPHLEFNPYVSTKSGGSGYEFGTSGLYTLFDSTLGDHFSLSICNLWLNESPKYLYSESFNPQELTWVNWAFVTAQFNSFFVNVGKEVIKTGTFEEDEYDYNNYGSMCSHFWNDVPLYQWGARAGWRAEDESAEMSFQVTSGAAGRWPFQEGITLNLNGYSDIGENSSLIAGLTWFNQKDLKWFLLAAGYQRYAGDATAQLDTYFYNRYGKFNTSVVASLKYEFEKFDVTAKAGFDHFKAEEGKTTSFFAGGVFQYYPLKHSNDLRLHATASFNGCGYPEYLAGESFFNFSVGVTYFLNLKLF